MSDPVGTRAARWPLALYPRDWRDRYGAEVTVLTSELIHAGDTSSLAAALNLTAGAVVERVRALARNGGGLAAAAAAAAIALAAVRPPHARQQLPYFDTAALAGTLVIVVLLGWFLLELVRFLYVHEHSQDRAGATKAQHPASFWLACAAQWIAMNAWLSLAPSITPAATIRPGAAAFTVGLVIFLAGACLRGWSIQALGPYYTAAIMVSPGQPVITRGPYRILRHPGYAASLLMCVGFGAMSANWIGLAALVLLDLGRIACRIRVEEGTLEAALGDRYGAYAARHRRLVPLVW